MMEQMLQKIKLMWRKRIGEFVDEERSIVIWKGYNKTNINRRNL